MDGGLVENFGDIFTLEERRAQMLELPRWGEKKVDNLLQSIQKTRENVTLSKVLFALAVPGVGQSICKQLSKKYKSSLPAIMEAHESTHRENGFSAAVSQSLVEFFADEENQEMVAELQKSLPV